MSIKDSGCIKRETGPQGHFSRWAGYLPAGGHSLRIRAPAARDELTPASAALCTCRPAGGPPTDGASGLAAPSARSGRGVGRGAREQVCRSAARGQRSPRPGARPRRVPGRLGSSGGGSGPRAGGGGAEPGGRGTGTGALSCPRAQPRWAAPRWPCSLRFCLFTSATKWAST